MKMRQSFVLLTIAVSMAFSFYACKKGKSGDSEPTEQAGKIQGMGDSTGLPKGELFVLPTGITTVGTIYGNLCDTAYKVGSGTLVEVCVAFFNSTTTDISLTIPAGLIFLATDAAANQHGILMQDIRVVLKANKLTRVGIGSYCINSSKHPSGYDDVYTFCPVTSSTLMQQLIGWLKNKKVNRTDYTDEDAYDEAKSTIQLLVWRVSDGPAIDAALRTEYLNKIPNK